MTTIKRIALAAVVGVVTAQAQASDVTATLGGRLQLDYAWYDNDKVERDDGGEVRRARLNVKGDIGELWDYKVQLEFSGDDPELRDGYVRYSGLGSGTLWLGQFRQPVSLELQTSSNNITFLERGLITGVGEGRRIGVGYHYAGNNYTLMGSVYGDEANGNSEGTGFQGRGTYVPVRQENLLVHLGASYGASEPDDGEFRIRVRPDSHVTDDRILDTGVIENVDDVAIGGLEAALQMNRFSAQAEYLNVDVSRDNDSDLSFDGWYAMGSFFLTPDQRPYSASKGSFGKVKPSQPGGAWEVAIRYSTVNLTDQEILGGEGDAVTLGLNWYPNQNLRFMANYSVVDTDDVAGDDDPSVFQVRMQIVF